MASHQLSFDRRLGLLLGCSLLFLCLAGASAQEATPPDPFYLSLLDKAQKSFLAKDYTEAARDLEIAAFGLTGDKTLRARALTYLGLSRDYLKDIKASEKCLRDAAELCGKDGFESLAIDPSASGDLEKLLAFYGLGTPGQAEGKAAENVPANRPTDGTLSQPVPAKPLSETREGDLLPIDMVDVVPALIKRIDPVYPASAKRLKIGGTVIVNVLISEAGDVVKAEIAKGIKNAPGFNQECLRAVRQWKFSPASIKGIKVKVWWTAAIDFRPEPVK